MTDLSLTKKKIKSLKFKAILKLCATGVVLVGGVVTGILFPNPISVAVTIGCATALSGGEGIKHTVKRYKKAKILKKKAQLEEKDSMEKGIVEKVKREFGVVTPSAPPAPQASQALHMYPQINNMNLNPVV